MQDLLDLISTVNSLLRISLDYLNTGFAGKKREGAITR